MTPLFSHIYLFSFFFPMFFFFRFVFFVFIFIFGSFRFSIYLFHKINAYFVHACRIQYDGMPLHCPLTAVLTAYRTRYVAT